MRGWRVIRDQLSKVGRSFRRWLGHPDIRSLHAKIDAMERSIRTVLGRVYPALKSNQNGFAGSSEFSDAIRGYEAGCYSQNGEDGCLLEILNRTGFEAGVIVEIGCGSGEESNAALLVCEFGWRGVLIDANNEQIKRAQKFYASEQAEDLSKFQACMINKCTNLIM